MRNRQVHETFPEFIPDNKLYKWNHSISKGGFYFVLGTRDRNPVIIDSIKNKLYKDLKKEAINLNLIDTTIKIFSTFFIIFTVFRPTTNPQDFIKKILGVANSFEINWDSEYLFSTIQDADTNFIESRLSTFSNEIKQNGKVNPNGSLTKFVENE